MNSKNLFLALIVVQALHSVEEYVFKLFETFPPARFVSGLVSADLERGFVAINLALATAQLWGLQLVIGENRPVDSPSLARESFFPD